MYTSSSGRRLFIKALAGGAAVGCLPAPAPLNAAAAVESEFLLADGLAYLNTGTLGPSRRATIEATQRAWELLEANPTAHYGQGVGAPMLDDTRIVAAKFLGCELDEMAVTSSTTAGMNAIAQGLRLDAGDRVLLTDQEHSGGLHCWQYLARHYGVQLDVVAIPRGEFRPAALVDIIAKGIRPDTRVISVSHVFSSTGLRMPVAGIAALARARGLMCVVDGAQAAGAIQVNLRELGCHAYATSGHKWLLGPKGTGLLYIAKDAREYIRPMAYEGSLRTYSDANGVVNLPAIMGLGTAIRHLDASGMAKVEAHNMRLCSRLIDKLSVVRGITLVSPPAGEQSSPLVAVLLPEAFNRGAVVRALLERHQVAIRPTHPEFGFNGIRFSVHEFNTDDDIDRAADALQKELVA
jgi:selenocysteine lyase/cysteine desulfurase